MDIADLANAYCFLLSGAPDTGCDGVEDLLDNGYKLALTEPGEKVLSPTLTIGGQVYFSSYLPEGGPTEAAECNAMKLGIGRGYAVSLFNGRPVINRNILDDNGLTNPTTSADRYEDDTWGSGIPTEYQSLGGNYIMGRPGAFQNANVSSYYRTYWYEKDVDH
jgi:type IV pilus assembly protein PilY1